MARFVFRFARLLKVKEAREKERQRELADAQQRAEAARKALDSVELQMARQTAKAREAMSGTVVPWRLLLVSEELARLRGEWLAAKERLSQRLQEVEETRLRLVGAMKERKILETLRRRDYEAFLIDEARKEQRFMDELAQKAGARRSLWERAGG